MPYWITVALIVHAAIVLFLIAGAARTIEHPGTLRTLAAAIPAIGLALVVVGFASFEFACDLSQRCGWLSARAMLVVSAVGGVAVGLWLWRLAGGAMAHRSFKEFEESIQSG